MLNHLAISLLTVAISTISAEPETIGAMRAERTDLFTLRVNGATFASVKPEPISVLIGTEMQAPMNAFTSEDGIIEWRVEADVIYEITMTDQSSDDPIREIVNVGMDREHEIQFAFYQIYEIQDMLKYEMNMNFFEMSAALQLLKEKEYVQ